METELLQSIPYAKNGRRIRELTKGYSFDKKYVVDDQYLIRVFPTSELEKRQIEFNTIKKLGVYSTCVPEALEFGTLTNSEFSYMVLSFLPGVDAEVGLAELTEDEQYQAGVLAGMELKKLHQLSAPELYPSWYTVKKAKSDRYLSQLKELDLSYDLVKMLEGYIKEHESLMKDRPNTFQHDDFLPANLLLHEKQFAGIIDFQRMDWGDPIHDLQKLGFFSYRVSVEFSKGIIDGYHDMKPISPSFWQLYTFYSVVHIVSALVWSKKSTPDQFELMIEYSLDVLKDHNQLESIIPSWYSV
ncbi:aminoglycoside phosphotransferase family protein [Bacillus alkalicellulosilyticus]|uniref:aminoglycoside phosphotransferase family protein n=1 Tax=Alkalihalobacterium alkalicellulosilyticum TaxID=1912214 RepID=UPI00099877E0|nr:aminoglycoside phosphotransferase family protein [Bacillus alkalicellulosilyticus]